MNILDVYTHLLSVANITVSEDGYLSKCTLNEEIPFIVNKKRVVLPTTEHLRNPNPDDLMIFHLLKENPLNVGDNELLAEFRKATNIKLNISAIMLMHKLIWIASDPTIHSKLNPDQSEFLSIAKEADSKTTLNFRKILNKIQKDTASNAVVSTYIKRGAEIEGKKHKRGTIVNFPLYKEILESSNTIHGVTVRKKDIEVYNNILKYIFPYIDTPEYYYSGSNSNIAPALESFMESVKKIGIDLNEQWALFGDQFENQEDTEIFSINFDWVEAFDNLESLYPQIKQILIQNDKVDTKPAHVGVGMNPIAPPSQMMPQGNHYPHQPPQPQPQPYINPQPSYPQHQYIQQPVNNPMPTTGGKIDLSAAFPHNPMTQYYNNPQQYSNRASYSNSFGNTGGGL